MTELHVGDRVTISFTVTRIDDDGDYLIAVDPKDDDDYDVDLRIGRLNDHYHYIPSGACIPEGHIVRAARRPVLGDELESGTSVSGASLKYLAYLDGQHFVTRCGGAFAVATHLHPRFAGGVPIDWTVG